MIPVHHIKLDPYIVLLAVGSVGYDNVVLIKVFAEFWEHGNISTEECKDAQNMKMGLLVSVLIIYLFLAVLRFYRSNPDAQNVLFCLKVSPKPKFIQFAIIEDQVKPPNLVQFTFEKEGPVHFDILA